MKPFALAALLASLAFPALGATVTDTQTFVGSYQNVFTRSIDQSYSLFESQQETLREEVFSFFDATAPSGTFNYFDESLGTLQRVIVRYERIGGNDDRVHLRSSGCRATLTGSCSVTVSTIADVLYGVDLATPTPRRLMDRGSTGPNWQTLTSYISLPEPNVMIYDTVYPWNGRQFIGTGSFDVDPFFRVGMSLRIECATGGIQLITGCAGEARISYSADYRITLEYTYEEAPVDPTTPLPPSTSVPLPASAALLLSGLGVLGASRTRSRSKRSTGA